MNYIEYVSGFVKYINHNKKYLFVTDTNKPDTDYFTPFTSLDKEYTERVRIGDMVKGIPIKTKRGLRLQQVYCLDDGWMERDVCLDF